MTNTVIDLLRNPATIRERSSQLFDYVLQDKSPNFSLQLDNLPSCCHFVLDLAKKKFPNLQVPFHSRWRHFEVNGIDRIQALRNQFADNPQALGRKLYELVIISVLLDAGAGSQWKYLEKETQLTHNRSEGLAIASLDMFNGGLFTEDNDLGVTLDSLNKLTVNDIAAGFQVSGHNPMNGLEGRANLVRSLAEIIEINPDIFTTSQRLGLLYDHIIDYAGVDQKKQIDASKVLKRVLDIFSPIWPGRIEIAGQNLGDVWQHSAIKGPEESNQLIPFHKLSQWLSYSLLEPLIWQGYQIVGLEQLTGLAEYRNGGFFIDSDVIAIKSQDILTTPQRPDNEAVIEWRALTICLLDKLYHIALNQLQFSTQDFPLVSFLEAGTWKAGRAIAKQKRTNSSPPIAIISDGTVF